MASDFGISGSVRLCESKDPDQTCLVLHGWSMKSRDMSDWWGKKLCEAFPTTEFIYLQAPISYQATGGKFETSWFKYIQEFDGDQEDVICEKSFEDTSLKLGVLIQKYSPKPTVLLGLSEGGCMALAVALKRDLGQHIKGIVTIVSHKISLVAKSDKKINWCALTANDDSIYPSTWAHTYLNEAISWHKIDDDHYLSSSFEAVDAFIRDSLMRLFKQET